MHRGTRQTPAHNLTEVGSEKDKQSLEKITAVDSTLPEIDPGLDHAITRKFDTRLLPWLFGLWLLAFIDRSNIGNARIDGLAKDLDLKGNRFNIVRPPALTTIRHTNSVMNVRHCRSSISHTS